VPFGTEVVVIDRGAVGAAATANDRVLLADCDGTALSTTFTPILNVPAAEGVPLRVPLEFKTNPVGTAVAADHTYGELPPLALSVLEKLVPTVAGGNDVVAITSGAAAATTVTLKLPVAVCLVLEESDTLTPIVNVPVAVGDPLSTPFALNASPAGNAVVAVHAYGLVPPEAPRVAV
jgi:hypothetical protein